MKSKGQVMEWWIIPIIVDIPLRYRKVVFKDYYLAKKDLMCLYKSCGPFGFIGKVDELVDFLTFCTVKSIFHQWSGYLCGWRCVSHLALIPGQVNGGVLERPFCNK